MTIASAGEQLGLLVLQDVPKYLELDGHHHPVPIYAGPEYLPGVPFHVAAVDAAQLVGKPIADLHKHDTAEVYLVLSPGLTFEIQTENGTVLLESPVSVLIPAGLQHRFVVREVSIAPCYFLGILMV